MPSAPAELGDALDLERDVAADVDEERRARPMLERLGLEIRERDAQVVAVAVHERDLGTGRPADSGVAMNVFDGQRTVSPRTSANSSAASAAPDQLLMATEVRPFHEPQAVSNSSTIGPCDQRSDVST